MDDFDTQWDNLDIDGLDINTTDDIDAEDAVTTTADKKAARIINKKDYEQNIDQDFDKWLDDDNPDGYNTADESTRWYKIISHMEANIKRQFADTADEFNYEMNNTVAKYQNAKQKNSPMTKFFSNKLNELNAKRKEIVDWAKGEMTLINFLKGRASGFITPENTPYWEDNPQAVRAELATGKYDYQPTTIK